MLVEKLQVLFLILIYKPNLDIVSVGIDKCISNVYTLVSMQTAIIHIRTDPEVKIKAQKIAKELGFSLSSLLNAWLHHLIKTKTVTFSLVDKQ